MKQCSRCRLWKGPQDFGANRSTRDGYDCYCRVCRREVRKEHYERSKKQHAAKSRRFRYGLSAVEVETMKFQQGGACAICTGELGPGHKTHVDHDHKTGKVRGLLCGHCNRGLGGFRDNDDYLTKAVAYLNSARQSVSETDLFSLGGDA